MAERPRDPKTGRFISAKQAEEVNKKLTETQKLLKDIGKDASISAEAFIDIAKALIEATKNQEDLATAGEIASATVKKQTSIAKELSGFTAEQLADKKQTNKILAKELVVKKNLASIESQIAKLAERSVNAEGEELDIINKSLGLLIGSRDESNRILKNFEKIKDVNEELNGKTKFFDELSGLVGDIPVVGKMFGDFKEGAEAARKAGAEGGSALKAGLGGVLSGIGKALMAFAGTTFFTGLFEGEKRIVGLSRQLNISEGRAAKLNNRFNQIGASTRGLVGEDILKATEDLSMGLGISANLSDDAAISVATLTKQLGMSGEQASALARISAGTGQNVEDLNNSIIGTTMVQNIANKTAIRYQDVLSDVANTSAATLLTTSKFQGGIGAAAFAARRLGLTLGEVAGISENLLDFESSISAEMEAEVMLGRNLELDKARLAAATGDQATLAAELRRLQQEGADFSEMNVFQQQAFAKALGMSREQLAESVSQQKVLDELGLKNNDTLDATLRKRIDAAIAAGDEQELAKLAQVAGAKELIRQRETATTQEDLLEVVKQMKESVQGLSTSLKPVGEAFASMAEFGGELFGFITKIGIKFKTLGKIITSAFVKPPQKALGFFGKISGAFKGMFKAGGKGAVKTILKKIPILGLLVGAGLAYSRFKKGDYLGAGMEFVSGVASLFPGIGTGVSLALDAGLMAMDAGGITGKNSKMAERVREKRAAKSSDTVIEGEDVIIKTLPQDTLAFAAGTQFGQETNDLLRQLLTTVQAGGDVILDGSSVGDVLMMNSRLTN